MGKIPRETIWQMFVRLIRLWMGETFLLAGGPNAMVGESQCTGTGTAGSRCSQALYGHSIGRPQDVKDQPGLRSSWSMLVDDSWCAVSLSTDSIR